MTVASQDGKSALKSWRQIARRLPPVERALRALRRTDEIVDLQVQLETIRQQLEGASGRGLPTASPTVRPFLEWAPPGHFYSPLPDLTSVDHDAERIFARPAHLPGIDLNEGAQLALFDEIAHLAIGAPLPAEAGGYFAPNDSYGAGDAIVLQSMLRKLRPERYVEVGSGWTTALAVDTNEAWLGGSTRITAIEPHGELLRRILPHGAVELLEQPVQHVPLHVFSELNGGDVLFIDCSHVVKIGSDAHHLVTQVLPVLSAGVHVHLHDIFWPFEYPRSWIEEGRGWSELYLLHAFLLFNPVFSIELFNDWLAVFHRDRIERKLPAMLENTGGALWLRVEPH
ncbi:MAG TPA: class I SAM-dependent methyltransferase [Chloroflexota bacterium]